MKKLILIGLIIGAGFTIGFTSEKILEGFYTDSINPGFNAKYNSGEESLIITQSLPITFSPKNTEKVAIKRKEGFYGLPKYTKSGMVLATVNHTKETGIWVSEKKGIIGLNTTGQGSRVKIVKDGTDRDGDGYPGVESGDSYIIAWSFQEETVVIQRFDIKKGQVIKYDTAPDRSILPRYFSELNQNPFNQPTLQITN
ncbi:MAG: hypothetical protein ABEJ83_01400 [Candidatus Nanohaloarchaea archaeon]